MRADSDRWVEVTPSEFAHERAGLALVRELLPDRTPYRAGSNFEFRDTSGKWHEVEATNAPNGYDTYVRHTGSGDAYALVQEDVQVHLTQSLS